MRIILTIAAITAAVATSATAKPTMHHHRAMPSENGSQAVKELNEKSLQQANAGSTGQPMSSSGAMSDSGGAAMAPSNAPPTGNDGAAMNPGNASTPPSGEATPPSSPPPQ